MSDSFGLGDGVNDLSGTPGLAESRVADAQRERSSHLEAERWPSTGTILRRLGLVLLALVAIGLALTALNT